MAQRKRNSWDAPAPIGFTYYGWTLVEIAPCSMPDESPALPMFFRAPMQEARFVSESGERMGALMPADQPVTVRYAKEAIFGYMWRQNEARLAREYALMC